MRSKLTLLSILAFVLLSSCTEINDPYYNSGGYGDPYYDSSHYRDDSYYRKSNWERERNERELERQREERRRLERERDRLEEERRRLERQRAEEEARRRRPPEERCPSGFHPSEQKCTPQERKKGCKDMRLPGGLGCVNR